MSEFGLQREEQQGTTYVVVEGELDIATAPRLEAELMAAVRPGTSVVVDLAGVTFLDSSGLRAILAGDAAARSHEVRYCVISARPAVQRVFDLTRLADEIEILPDRASLAGR